MNAARKSDTHDTHDAHDAHDAHDGNALAAWLDSRSALMDAALLERARQTALVWARRDGHRRYIDDHDARRDAVRAQRMVTALRATRERAQERPSLDVAALVALASIALAARPELRSGAAFAKSGGEIYDVGGTVLLARFPYVLAEIDDAAVPLIVRAARVYLDVCFFHPLVDGNARAARLACDFVLSRGGVRFDLVAPMFCVARPAADGRAHQSLVNVMCTLADATARRLEQSLHHRDHTTDKETAT